jgi:integrase
MASINVRKDTGKLYLDFRFRNQRCREQTKLTDTVANRKKLQKVLDRIEAEITLGCFDYAATFPDSKAIEKIKRTDAALVSNRKKIPNMNEFCDTWYEEVIVDWSIGYQRAVKNIIEKRIKPFFNDLPVNQIDKQKVLEFRKFICEIKKKDGKAISAHHINRHLKVIRMILNEAADRYEFLTAFRNIKLMKVPKTDVKPFTLDEIAMLLDCVRDDYHEYLLVRFFTGMRSAEIDGLKWKYVDFDRQIIKVRETHNDRGVVGYTKNDASQRDIKMSEPVLKALLDMKKRTGHHPYVFTNYVGKPINQSNFRNRVWYPLLAYLGLEKRVPYNTRHTCSTLWLASGENPTWIAYQLGHANTEMLFRVYSRYVPNLTRNDGSEANKMFAGVLGGDHANSN